MHRADPVIFAPNIAALLAPIAGAQSAGVSMRYEPAYLQIRKAREQDDPTLPRGEWIRELKKADWPLVVQTATDLLATKTKDFQVAAWLCEAWIHLHHLEGLNAAIELLHGLVQQFWEHAYPQIDEGDEDARLAPFIWINENIPVTLSLQVSLLFIQDRKPGEIRLADWDKTLTQELIPEKQKSKVQSGEEKPLTRDDIVAAAHGANLSRLVQLKLQLAQAVRGWSQLIQLLDSRVQSSPPSLARVTEMLRRLERAVETLLDGRDIVLAPEPELPLPLVDDSEPPEEAFMTTTESKPNQQRTGAGPHFQGAIESREDAYRRLEQIADYLMKTEPHSPTPYLIKRAVSWGRMSLVDLMLEVVREEGDMTRYLSLLGIKEVAE